MAFSKLIRKITGSSEPTTTDRPINITPKLSSISVIHNGKKVIIERNQNSQARIDDLFSKTSRPCPPFCVQPITIAPGVETIAELEMIAYLQQSTDDDSILIIDSRIKEWVDLGTIPSSKNIPWTSLTLDNELSFKKTISILQDLFNVKITEGITVDDLIKAFNEDDLSGKLDFSEAKTLILFCNGSWCGQTPKSVLSLLELSYPANKIKYYRDGIQGWLNLGLTTVVTSTDKSKAACKLVPS